MIEILAVIVTAALVLILLAPNLLGHERGRSRINCANNLRNIGLGFRTYAVDYNGLYPWKVAPSEGGIALPSGNSVATASNNVLILFACISNEISTPKIIRCPSDKRPQMISNTWLFQLSLGIESSAIPSYFIGTDASERQPLSILSGDRNLLIPSAGLDFKTPENYNRIASIGASDMQRSNLKSIAWPADIHSDAGNILLGDGSVRQTSNRQLRNQFHDSYKSLERTSRSLCPPLTENL